MPDIVKTMKLHIHVDDASDTLLREVTDVCRDACNEVSEYVFHHGFCLNSVTISNNIYHSIRDKYGLKSQMTQSVIRIVTARYKTVKEQLFQNPYKYRDEDGKWHYITRTLEWLQHPIVFRRPQADLVRGRDYSFTDGGRLLSLNTLQKRIKVSFDVPACFADYFDGTWSFGTGKLVSLRGEWYFHIPVTKTITAEFSRDHVKHVVGIDRGLRFLVSTCDEKGQTGFVSGKDVLRKRNSFNKVRAELQSKGTKSAKRALKRISGRENRWMADINHQLSRALVRTYGSDTLYVIEDLAGVSFAEENLSGKNKQGRNEIRSWSFFQLEQFLTYKASETGSHVLKVNAAYTSQRCPKCGRIHKDNRHHDIHEYICDCCGYRSNDDRIGAMNLQLLGTQYVSGIDEPRIQAKGT